MNSCILNIKFNYIYEDLLVLGCGELFGSEGF